MKTVIVGSLAFVGGVAIGLLVAKLYARQQVTEGAHKFLDSIGLGGGVTQNLVDSIVIPAVV
jgi:hypothetical protein